MPQCAKKGCKRTHDDEFYYYGDIKQCKLCMYHQDKLEAKYREEGRARHVATLIEEFNKNKAPIPCS